MFSEYDVVRIRSAATESSIPVGTLRTVLIIHPGTPLSYVVEFVDDAGNTLDWFTVPEQELEFVEKA